MDVHPTDVVDCFELRLVPKPDARGSFLKLFHAPAFADLDLELAIQELFVSRSHRGVVRGLHFQRPPADVAKLVCCLEGAIADVVVDLRLGSPTLGRHALVQLSADAANAIYVPRGCAHGFLVMADPALVLYAQSGVHDPQLEGGVLWSSAGISWPGSVTTVSDRDAGFPPLDAFNSPFRYAMK